MIVYLVTNNVNGKIYVGQTRNSLERRWQGHISHAKNGNYTLQRAIIKYGANAFSISEIARASSLQELCELETSFIRNLRSNDPEIGYNIAVGGISGPYNHTPEARRQMSFSKKGKPLSDHHKQALHKTVVRKIELVCGNPNFRMCCYCGMYDDPSDMKKTFRKSGHARFHHTRNSQNWNDCKTRTRK